MRAVSAFAFLFFVFTGLTGCGERVGRVSKEDARPPVAGTLTPLVRSFEGHAGESACDQKIRSIRLQIANAIDEKQPLIRAYTESLPESTYYKRVQVGPLVIRENKARREPKIGWQTDNYSWKKIIESFESIRHGGTPADWYALNSDVNAILTNDQARILDGVPYAYGHNDPRALGGLTLNATVRREGDTFILPLAAGPFTTIEKELAQYIETVWRSERFQLKIDWLTEPLSGFFRMLRIEIPGARAWVGYRSQTVNIASDIRAKSLAHEIGHVLGFPDRYYTLWDAENCEYTDEYREDDLMSEAPTGSVLESDWNDLDRLYPKVEGVAKSVSTAN